MKAKPIIPRNYKPILDLWETERAILLIKRFFQTNLAFELNLMRVTAPLFVKGGMGINDDLNGIERPVSFPVKQLNDEKVEVVQSLAKWKRLALANLGFKEGEGLYTDMNAIRADELLDNIHSLYVDQWDWERVITPEERTIEFLKNIVRKIYEVMLRTEKYICHTYPIIKRILPDKITFIHSEDLETRYPELTPVERENVACREHGAVFIIGIGYPLKNGKPHDGRAPDYDDWSTPSPGGHHGLNGDILVYYPLLKKAYELSSMGIRVDKKALEMQLDLTGKTERKQLYFHKKLLNGSLPLAIGGGIGQSRLCMFYLRKVHIGEIQSGIWPDDMVKVYSKHNIKLL